MLRALAVFKARHQFATSIFYDALWEDYDEAQWRTPAHPSMNTLAWIMWHVARVEDAGVSRFVAQQPQLLDDGAWNERLGLDVGLRHFGYQMTHEEMLALSASINLEALRLYQAAVAQHTFDLLETFTPELLDETLSQADVNHVLFQEGAAQAQSTDLLGIYSGWTRLEALYHFSTTHYYWHGGEVRTIEGLLRG